MVAEGSPSNGDAPPTLVASSTAQHQSPTTAPPEAVLPVTPQGRNPQTPASSATPPGRRQSGSGGPRPVGRGVPVVVSAQSVPRPPNANPQLQQLYNGGRNIIIRQTGQGVTNDVMQRLQPVAMQGGLILKPGGPHGHPGQGPIIMQGMRPPAMGRGPVNGGPPGGRPVQVLQGPVPNSFIINQANGIPMTVNGRQVITTNGGSVITSNGRPVHANGPVQMPGPIPVLVQQYNGQVPIQQPPNLRPTGLLTTQSITGPRPTADQNPGQPSRGVDIESWRQNIRLPHEDRDESVDPLQHSGSDSPNTMTPPPMLEMDEDAEDEEEDDGTMPAGEEERVDKMLSDNARKLRYKIHQINSTVKAMNKPKQNYIVHNPKDFDGYEIQESTEPFGPEGLEKVDFEKRSEPQREERESRSDDDDDMEWAGIDGPPGGQVPILAGSRRSRMKEKKESPIEESTVVRARVRKSDEKKEKSATAPRWNIDTASDEEATINAHKNYAYVLMNMEEEEARKKTLQAVSSILPKKKNREMQNLLNMDFGPAGNIQRADNVHKLIDTETSYKETRAREKALNEDGSKKEEPAAGGGAGSAEKKNARRSTRGSAGKDEKTKVTPEKKTRKRKPADESLEDSLSDSDEEHREGIPSAAKKTPESAKKEEDKQVEVTPKEAEKKSPSEKPEPKKDEKATPDQGDSGRRARGAAVAAAAANKEALTPKTRRARSSKTPANDREEIKNDGGNDGQNTVKEENPDPESTPEPSSSAAPAVEIPPVATAPPITTTAEYQPPMKTINEWTVEEVADFVYHKGMRLATVRDSITGNMINGEVLAILTKEEMKQLEIPLGPSMLILRARDEILKRDAEHS